MKKIICLVLFVLALTVTLSANVLAVSEQKNDVNNTKVFEDGDIQYCRCELQYNTGGFWFWDDAEAHSYVWGSWDLAYSQMKAYSYSYIKNEYDGNWNESENNEVHYTSRFCETEAAIDDVYATKYKAIGRFWVDGNPKCDESISAGF